MEDCQAAIQELVQNGLNGDKFPKNLMMPVINRYQMNRFSAGQNGMREKEIKKLLYILWECLPKREPDGKFIDRMVMVCGAFDKDLKHPNEYVCGSALRALEKTREPDVIRELVHSIEKCLDLPHPYQRKNAISAITEIFIRFPDLNPSAPKLISEHLMKESDDECKRAALKALLKIDPEEARPYLHSSNVQDIHRMNYSIQLIYIRLIREIFKKNSDEAADYLEILKSLTRSSSWPAVRYQAASTLMRFSRTPEDIKLVAACFIDTCAKNSDNNGKIDALERLTTLRCITGAERVLRNLIMDILFILQSATDFEIQEKVLNLSLDLITPLNVGGVVVTLKQEIERNVNDPERVKYRRLLVDSVHKIAKRFPNSIVEFEMIDTLINLLTSNTVGDRTSSRLILLFREFMSNNPKSQGSVLKKIQTSFNIAKDSMSTHHGLIKLLGDFSQTKDQIEKSYAVLKESLGELPLLESELRRREQKTEGDVASGADKAKSDSQNNQMNNNINKDNSTANGDVDMVTKGMKRLVTADGSYAAQSAINYQTSGPSNEEQPPLRSYYLNNKFDTVSVLCYALPKMACHYQQTEASKSDKQRMIARFMSILVSIARLGQSNLTDSEGNTIHINNDHAESLMSGLELLQNISNFASNEEHQNDLTKKILLDDFRSQIGQSMQNMEKKTFDTSESFKSGSKLSGKSTRFDNGFSIPLLMSRDDDVDLDKLIELKMNEENNDNHNNDDDDDNDSGVEMPQMPETFHEIPLTGSIDPIYAYCVLDVNHYNISVKTYLESRARTTLENVNLELNARGDNATIVIERPDSIVLAPRAKACITTNFKVFSAENRHLFGCITYDAGPGGNEQTIPLNDFTVNITDYIHPASISFDDFRDVWRHCEWENKVTVLTKLTSQMEYLRQLIASTNMRCVTTDKQLHGDCVFLLANLYARSSFGEEVLVNVSLEKETPQSVVTGSVKIRSRSQGMAVSLGAKINKAL